MNFYDDDDYNDDYDEPRDPRPVRNPWGQSLSFDQIQIKKGAAYPLSAGDALRGLFDIIKQRPFMTVGFTLLLYFFVALVSGFLGAFPSVVLEIMEPEGVSVNAGEVLSIGPVFRIFSKFMNPLLTSGLISILWLRLLRNQKFTFSDLYPIGRSFIPLVITCLMASIAICVGLVFFIVPGVILWFGFSMVPMLVVDKNIKYLEALKASWDLMKGHKGDYFGFAFLIGMINIVGFLALGVGLLLTIPLTLAAPIAYYANLTVPGNAYDEDAESADDLQNVFR